MHAVEMTVSMKYIAAKTGRGCVMTRTAPIAEINPKMTGNTAGRSVASLPSDARLRTSTESIAKPASARTVPAMRIPCAPGRIRSASPAAQTPAAMVNAKALAVVGLASARSAPQRAMSSEGEAKSMPHSRKFSATSASSAMRNQCARKPCEWFDVEASDDRMPWGGNVWLASESRNRVMRERSVEVAHQLVGSTLPRTAR